MRAFVVAAALSVILAAAPGFAQAPAAAPAPAPAPAPAAPQGAPAQAPFPTGAKYAFVNIQRIAAESAQGKALSSRVQTLNTQKVNELNEKNKALQAAQQKLESGASVLNEAARSQLEKDIDRQQTDIQRFTDDAQKDVQELQNELQAEFQQKLGPVIQQVAQEKKLEILFSALDAGIVWADAGLDLTTEVIRRFDAANPAPSAAAPAAAPAPRPATPAAASPAPAGRQGAPAAPRPAAPAAPRSGGPAAPKQ
jgi:Skp family chaperone for outer membrane proteins